MSGPTLDHVQVAMPAGGEDAARRFYAGLLGLAEIPKPDALRSAGGVWFDPGVHVGVEHDFRPARKAHPAIAVDDLEALANRLASAGHRVAWDDRWPDRRRLYTDDPFGNRVELLARAPD